MQTSPRYTIEDWNFGRCTDLDIAEDQLRGWVLGPAQAMAQGPDSGVALLVLLAPYFEAMGAYHAGQAAAGNSDALFTAGLQHVFPDVEPAAHAALVRAVRHGLLHGGLFRRPMVHRGNALFPSFGLLPDGKTLGVDPWFVLARAVDHCDGYFASLRVGTDTARLDAFQTVMDARRKG